MKTNISFLFFLVFLFLSSCMVIPPYHTKYYLGLSDEQKRMLKLEPLDMTNLFDDQILSINSHDFFSVIKNDTLECKMLVFFTFWCPSSQEYLPEFIKKFDDSTVRIFYVSPDDWVYKPQYVSYKASLGLKSNVYLLDVNKYGEKRNPHYRMKKFITEICDDCQNIKGFPAFILFNEKNEIVYKNAGSIPPETIRDILR